MSDLAAGDSVIVNFDGVDSPGEIEKIEHGWVTCRVFLDLTEDYGSMSPSLSPISTVCVRRSNVRRS